MSSLIGVWKHEMPYGGASVVTIQTIRDDGRYETHMIHPAGGGGRQHIHHEGRIEFDDAVLQLHFESGRTCLEGCGEVTKNFDMRDFTDAETAETTGLLARKIPYEINGDTLTTTVTVPGMGEMKIAYTRQV